MWFFFFLNCGYILTPLYREGGLLFLLDKYLSFTADKIRAREGGGEIRDIIQTFFPHSDFRFVSAHNGQIRSQTKSTVRSRWPLRATATYNFFFMDRRKKSTR